MLKYPFNHSAIGYIYSIFLLLPGDDCCGRDQVSGATASTGSGETSGALTGGGTSEGSHPSTPGRARRVPCRPRSPQPRPHSGDRGRGGRRRRRVGRRVGDTLRGPRAGLRFPHREVFYQPARHHPPPQGRPARAASRPPAHRRVARPRNHENLRRRGKRGRQASYPGTQLPSVGVPLLAAKMVRHCPIGTEPEQNRDSCPPTPR